METVIMNPRLAATAAWSREIAIPALVLAWTAASGFVGIDHSGAAPIADGLAQSLAADARFVDDARFADKPQPVALGTADVVTADGSVTRAATEVAPPAHEPEPVVTAALTDSSSETLQPETPPDEAAKTSMATREPGDA